MGLLIPGNVATPHIIPIHNKAQRILTFIAEFSNVPATSTNNPFASQDFTQLFNFTGRFDYQQAFGHDSNGLKCNLKKAYEFLYYIYSTVVLTILILIKKFNN